MRLNLTVTEANAILRILHEHARATGDTTLYSRFVALVGHAMRQTNRSRKP